eukprot:UN31362
MFNHIDAESPTNSPRSTTTFNLDNKFDAFTAVAGVMEKDRKGDQEPEIFDSESSEEMRRRYALRVGDKVELIDKTFGHIRFIGKVDFNKGIWFGIEVLPPDSGKHNGTVAGVKYFDCPAKTGIIIKKKELK